MTGRPGIGKTTIITNVIDKLGKGGYLIGGMVTREVREKGSRIGFEIVDVSTGQKGWLAQISQSVGPQVGKYRVNLNDLDQVGVRAIQDALATADLIIVDEIGPMELFSPRFRQTVQDVLDSDKTTLGVVHYKARAPLIDSIKKRSDAEVIEVNERNRESLHNVIIDRMHESLEEKRQAKNKGT